MQKKVSCLVGVLVLLLSLEVSALSSDQALSNRVKQLPTPSKVLNKYRASEIIRALNNIADTNIEKCEDVTFVNNSERFMTSYDAAGKPCRIYDLSFPTLRHGAKGASIIGALPLKKFTSDVYLKWLDGDYSAAEKATTSYVDNFSINTYRQSWVAKLPFRKGIKRDKSGIVRSFTLADLELPRFAFSYSQRRSLRRLFKNPGISNFDSFIDNPKSLLGKIRLDWNDIKKVYELVLEFDFLPLKGPVALVDYSQQYRFSVERMARTAVKKAMLYVANRVPNKLTKRLVSYAITEAFDFLDMTYVYHLNQLEMSLRMNMEGTLMTSVKRSELDQGMNILFANKESLLTQYIMGLTTGKPLDLAHLDKLGRTSRYNAEKLRRTTMKNLYSQLALKKHCKMSRIHRYFGECVKDDGDRFLYSLLSNNKILFWNLGAYQIHDYQHPHKISLMRRSAYLLSSALYLFQIKLVPSFITEKLVTILKDFSRGGVLDEGMLLDELTELSRIQSLPAEDQYLMNWLYKQRVNPFLAHSVEMENRAIQASGL